MALTKIRARGFLGGVVLCVFFFFFSVLVRVWLVCVWLGQLLWLALCNLCVYSFFWVISCSLFRLWCYICVLFLWGVFCCRCIWDRLVELCRGCSGAILGGLFLSVLVCFFRVVSGVHG